MRTESPKKKHVGLQLAAEIGAKLDELIAREQERVGPTARVSVTSYVEGLILAAWAQGQAGRSPTSPRGRRG